MTDTAAPEGARTVTLADLRERLALPDHETHALMSWLGPWLPDEADDDPRAPHWTETEANEIVTVWGLAAADAGRNA